MKTIIVTVITGAIGYIAFCIYYHESFNFIQMVFCGACVGGVIGLIIAFIIGSRSVKTTVVIERGDLISVTPRFKDGYSILNVTYKFKGVEYTVPISPGSAIYKAMGRLPVLVAYGAEIIEGEPRIEIHCEETVKDSGWGLIKGKEDEFKIFLPKQSFPRGYAFPLPSVSE